MASLDKDVEVFIKDNRRHLNDEAIAVLKGMPQDDQRRVLAAGPLDICTRRELGGVFRKRAQLGREREQELAARKGVEVARMATGEEVRQWLDSNSEYMDEFSVSEFNAMSGEDKLRVITDGSLRPNVDVIYLIRTRASHQKELTQQVEAVFAQKRLQSQDKGREPELKPMAPRIAGMMQDVFNSYVPAEVPAHLRRTSGYAQNVPEQPKKEELVGSVKGVGGVIEILKNKYQCSKGQRWKVIGETPGPAGIWRLKGPEGDRSVPKTHFREGGWKWVLEEEEEEEVKKQLEAKHVLAKKPEASPLSTREVEVKPLEGTATQRVCSEARSQSRKRSGDASEAGASARAKKRKKKSPSRSSSSGSHKEASRKEAKVKRRRSPSPSSGRARSRDKDEDSGRRTKHKRKAKHKKDREGRKKERSRSVSSRDPRKKGRRK